MFFFSSLPSRKLKGSVALKFVIDWYFSTITLCLWFALWKIVVFRLCWLFCSSLFTASRIDEFVVTAKVAVWLFESHREIYSHVLLHNSLSPACLPTFPHMRRAPGRWREMNEFRLICIIGSYKYKWNKWSYKGKRGVLFAAFWKLNIALFLRLMGQEKLSNGLPLQSVEFQYWKISILLLYID